MSTDRPATTDQQPMVYGATQPARLVITETIAASRTQGDGPWTTAEAILGALKQAGYRIFRPVDESLDVWGDEQPPLTRAGYSVAEWPTPRPVAYDASEITESTAARASEAPGDAQSPTPDVGAAQGGEGGSAAESEPRVHYEVEVFRSIKRLGKRSWRLSASPRDHENSVIVAAEIAENTGYRTRIVRVTREVIQ